jgi:hypothetical protein
VSLVLGRIADQRARQYWDPDHVLARRMAADARAPQPEHDCCVRSGVLWDLAAVYPRGALWTETLPPATVFNGPVIDITAAIAAALKSPD